MTLSPAPRLQKLRQGKKERRLVRVRTKSYLGLSLLQKGLMRLQGLRTRKAACLLHETMHSLK